MSLGKFGIYLNHFIINLVNIDKVALFGSKMSLSKLIHIVDCVKILGDKRIIFKYEENQPFDQHEDKTTIELPYLQLLFNSSDTRKKIIMEAHDIVLNYYNYNSFKIDDYLIVNALHSFSVKSLKLIEDRSTFNKLITESHIFEDTYEDSFMAIKDNFQVTLPHTSMYTYTLTKISKDGYSTSEHNI